MHNNHQTERLVLTAITLSDAMFMAALVNTPPWINFIGDRNIRTQDDAAEYIQSVMDNPNARYWVVRLAEQQTPIGIVTFIKRDYLEHSDIGFAFFSEFTNKGYAQEAVTAVMNDIMRLPLYATVYAVTVKENVKSIKLLEKLGFGPGHEISHDNRLLLVYAVSSDKFFIQQITNMFYGVFTNADQQVPALDKIYTICLPEAIIIRKNGETEVVYDLASFIKPRKEILSDGTLTGFREYQTFEETNVVGNMAQRFSRYAKKGNLNGEYFEANGTKLFQYVKTIYGWKIAAVMWEDEVV